MWSPSPSTPSTDGATVARANVRAVERHRARWGHPELVARAPGRVNLVGDHTEADDGFALPVALPFDTVVTLSSNGNRLRGPVVVDAAGHGTVELTPGAEPPDHTAPLWAHHLAATVHLLDRAGVPAGGWRGVVDTDLPLGAGLGSAATLVVAVVTALVARAGARWTPVDVGRLGRSVAQQIGAPAGGLVDPLISAGARAGHATLIDCRLLTLTPLPLPEGARVVVMDTGTRHRPDPEWAEERLATCRRAASHLGVGALRDTTPDRVATLAEGVVRRRARHVVTENVRARAAAEAITAGQLERLGWLLTESHDSLRHDFEVSSRALDHMVAVARQAPGCYGARMTGAGFAGCAVAVVDAEAADAFVTEVLTAYDLDEHRATLWVVEPAAGASVAPAASLV